MMYEELEDMDVDIPTRKPNGAKLSRGEKSRIAAKCRRDKENIAMNEIIDELPVANDVLNKMDKAAVIKLAISYIKIKHFVQKDLALYGHRPITSGTDSSPSIPQKRAAEGQLMLEALNGFMIFVSKKGTIKFISNTVTDHLGLKQEQMMGRNVMEYVHVNDQQEFHKHFKDDKGVDVKKLALRPRPTGRLCDEPQRVFYLRMKFNLPKPGTKTRQQGHLLVQWSGKMKRHLSSKTAQCVTDGLLCICRPMQTTPLLEIRMDGNMFMSRHDLGMTFTFCDTRILTLIGYEPNELVGKTAYHFHNPIDAPKVSQCHQNLIIKGTSVSKYYRFLGKNDNWVWLQTRATIIYNTANKPQYIVCMNYVISEEEGERYLMLEEHQYANKQSDNTILTLPDNQHHDPHCHHPESFGPRIIELEEDHLIKTARFPPSDSVDSPPDASAICNGDQQINDSMVFNSSSSPAMSPPDVDSLDLNAPALDSPETSTSTLSNNGSPQPASEACGATYQPMDPFNQPIHMGCTNSYSNTDSGYDSGNSPYNGHHSPQIVSPGSGFAQGSGHQMSAYSPSNGENMATDQFDNESIEVHQAEQVLDTLLKDFTSADGIKFNTEPDIAAIFSTIQSLTSQTEAPVSTFVQSPGQSNTFPLPRQTPVMAPQKRPEQKSNSTSVLRNILTMPKTDLPKDLPTGLQFNNKTCPKQGSHSVNQGSLAQQLSAQKVTSTEAPVCNGQSKVNSWVMRSCNNGEQCPSVDTNDDPLGLSGIPDEISDFAMQYLGDVMDMQADSVISQFQNGDADFMDTSDSDVLTKVLINSLESHCSPPLTQTLDDDGYRGGSNLTEANIPVSQCHSPTNGKYMPRVGSSSHDHVYHQSVNRANNRSRSQKIPGTSGIQGLYTQGNRQCATSSCQTQTSEYCLSELERHLKNKRAEMTGGGDESLSTSPKPFLEQLLTGELTKDMYMKMEQARFGDSHGPK